ncbi:MAG TPA: hypothetical protein VFH90_03025 [Candidatus Limnocylindria bacterium]|nr:hypothetical protein [Candidatus Limnocylindria bacterium]
MRRNFSWGSRHRLIGPILTMTLLTAMPVVALAANNSDPFVGSYRAIDTSFDNSNMQLAFGGPDSPGGPSNIRRVVWLDEVATVACDGGRFFAEGVGIVDGNTILVVFEVYCGSAGNLIGEDTVEFTFVPASGTLLDSYDIVWNRP